MYDCYECSVLSGRGLCDELIPRLEESYRLWCVVLFDIKTSCMRGPSPTGGLLRPPPQKVGFINCTYLADTLQCFLIGNYLQPW